MKDKKYCEFVIEGIYEFSKENEKEIIKKIKEAINILVDEKLIKVDTSVTKYSATDVLLSIVKPSDGDIN